MFSIKKPFFQIEKKEAFGEDRFHKTNFQSIDHSIPMPFSIAHGGPTQLPHSCTYFPYFLYKYFPYLFNCISLKILNSFITLNRYDSCQNINYWKHLPFFFVFMPYRSCHLGSSLDLKSAVLFFSLSLSLPTDLKNMAEKISSAETTIDETICGKELPKIRPIVKTTTNTRPNTGSHFLIMSFLFILIICIIY